MDQALCRPVDRSGIFDLERVEVLKGSARNTLGNNATGGAINYIAASRLKHACGLSVGYGRFETYDVDGYVSAP